MFLTIEFCLVVLCLAIACVHPQLGDQWFERIERHFSAFAKRRAWAVATVGLLALGIRLGLLPILPIPQPKVTDEFSYLLMADTFAHGRLANPTHPMWIHFETFQVNWLPTYASMYYPGHGLFLAFGQVIFGHPFWGVWLSSGLMFAATCWALQGWVGPAWALLGGLLALIRLGTFSYWVDSYWGGTVAALGGALVFGALPRIKLGHRVRNSVVMAIGMALLAMTRPYEGLFFCIPVMIDLLLWSARTEAPWWQINLKQIAVPATFVLALAFIGLGYYFRAVTGSPFTTPYQVNMRMYGLIYFPWDKINPVPGFHHAVMQMFYRGGSVVGWHEFALAHPFKLQALKAVVVWLFYFGPALTLPWLAWTFTRRRREFWKSLTQELRFLLLLCAVTYLSVMMTIYIGQPHYAAPLTAAYYAITLLMMRDLYKKGAASDSGMGRFMARSVPLICLLLLVARIAAPIFHAEPKPSWIRTWCSQDEQNIERARILQLLEHTPGDHLVIVRYWPNHDFILDEWVYNKADIDGSKVIWARDMGPQNSELVSYFKQRRAWLLEPDYNPPRLSAYVQ